MRLCGEWGNRSAVPSSDVLRRPARAAARRKQAPEARAPAYMRLTTGLWLWTKIGPHTNDKNNQKCPHAQRAYDSTHNNPSHTFHFHLRRVSLCALVSPSSSPSASVPDTWPRPRGHARELPPPRQRNMPRCTCFRHDAVARGGTSAHVCSRLCSLVSCGAWRVHILCLCSEPGETTFKYIFLGVSSHFAFYASLALSVSFIPSSASWRAPKVIAESHFHALSTPHAAHAVQP
jgi:hypothetical protein